MPDIKELMKPPKINTKFSNKTISENDERLMLTYYSEGKEKSMSVIEFERMALWNEELSRFILIELFNRAQSEESLDQLLRKRMMAYIQNLAKDRNPDDLRNEMERFYITVYNPMNSLNYLNIGISKTTAMGIVECVNRSIDRKNTYYSLTPDGVPWVTRQLADAYKNQKWMLESLSKGDKIPVYMLMMKWIELDFPKVDQLIVLCSRKQNTMSQFVQMMQQYYVIVEGENLDSKMDETPIYQECLQRVSRLIESGLIEFDKETNSFSLTEGRDGTSGKQMLSSIMGQFFGLINELEENYVINIDNQQNSGVDMNSLISISHVGKNIMKGIVILYQEDLELLAQPPRILNDVDFHESETPVPPLHIFIKNNNNKLKYAQKKVFEMHLYKELSWIERAKNFYFNSGFNGALFTFGIGFILLGIYSALIYINATAVGLIVIGSVMFFIAAYGITMRWKMDQPQYTKKEVYKKYTQLYKKRRGKDTVKKTYKRDPKS